jgi:hypothetical protein
MKKLHEFKHYINNIYVHNINETMKQVKDTCEYKKWMYKQWLLRNDMQSMVKKEPFAQIKIIN